MIYVGLVAIVQKDMKKLVACLSVAHGRDPLGFFISNTWVSQGLADDRARFRVVGAMFLCIGVLYDRVHSRQIADYGGWSTPCPSLQRSRCCCSPWPTAACPRRPVASVDGDHRPRCVSISDRPALPQSDRALAIMDVQGVYLGPVVNDNACAA